MTFDDGILKIFSVLNSAKDGDMPKEVLTLKSSYHFHFENLGITRYYTALSHSQQIDVLVSIYQDRSISSLDIIQLEDGLFYKIDMIQHHENDEGIKITTLTLEHLNDKYQFEANKN